MRRSAVLQRIEQESKFLIGIFIIYTKQTEDPLLHLRTVDTDTSTTQFYTVEHQVVCPRLHRQRFFLHKWKIIRMWRGKGVMKRLITFLILVIIKEREVHNP